MPITYFASVDIPTIVSGVRIQGVIMGTHGVLAPGSIITGSLKLAGNLLAVRPFLHFFAFLLESPLRSYLHRILIRILCD